MLLCFLGSFLWYGSLDCDQSIKNPLHMLHQILRRLPISIFLHSLMPALRLDHRILLGFRFFAEFWQQFRPVQLKAFYFFFEVFYVVFHDVECFFVVFVVLDEYLDKKTPLLSLFSQLGRLKKRFRILPTDLNSRRRVKNDHLLLPLLTPLMPRLISLLNHSLNLIKLPLLHITAK